MEPCPWGFGGVAERHISCALDPTLLPPYLSLASTQYKAAPAVFLCQQQGCAHCAAEQAQGPRQHPRAHQRSVCRRCLSASGREHHESMCMMFSHTWSMQFYWPWSFLIWSQYNVGLIIPGGGGVQEQVRWDPEQPDLVNDITSHGRGVGTRWSLRFLPFYNSGTKLWFHHHIQKYKKYHLKDITSGPDCNTSQIWINLNRAALIFTSSISTSHFSRSGIL